MTGVYYYKTLSREVMQLRRLLRKYVVPRRVAGRLNEALQYSSSATTELKHWERLCLRTMVDQQAYDTKLRVRVSRIVPPCYEVRCKIQWEAAAALPVHAEVSAYIRDSDPA